MRVSDEGTHAVAAIAEAMEEIRLRAAGVSDEIAESMNSIETGTAQFLDGARSSKVAAQNLNELAAKLAALTERYRVATA